MNTMVLAAKSGVSIGDGAYAQIPSQMLSRPSSLLVAYEQAVYYIALGIRRALRESNTMAAAHLSTVLQEFEDEEAQVAAEVTWLCTMTGLSCPKGGSAQVLSAAIQAIEDAGLSEDDRVQLTAPLRSNLWGVRVRSAAPAVIAVGLGAAVGAWFFHRKMRDR